MMQASQVIREVIALLNEVIDRFLPDVPTAQYRPIRDRLVHAQRLLTEAEQTTVLALEKAVSGSYSTVLEELHAQLRGVRDVAREVAETVDRLHAKTQE